MNESARVAEDDVWRALHAVIDPELDVDFVDLGLIYEVTLEPGERGTRVHVVFSLTSPGCGIGPQIATEIEEVVEALDGVERAFPRLVLTPPWTPERMSEEARFALGFAG